MSSGFDQIVENVARILNSSKKLVLFLEEEHLDMLNKLAAKEQEKPEDLATALLIQALQSYFHATDELVQIWEELPERQQEVAALACLGYTNDEIAQKLFISAETVKTHFSRVLPKFHARGRHQLRYMLRGWDFSKFDS